MGTFNGDSQQGLTAGCQFSEPSNRGHSSWGHTSGPGPSTGDTLRVASSRNHPTGAASGDIQVDAALGTTQWDHTMGPHNGDTQWGHAMGTRDMDSQPWSQLLGTHIPIGAIHRGHPSGTRSGDSQTVAAQPGHPPRPSIGDTHMATHNLGHPTQSPPPRRRDPTTQSDSC